MTITAITYPCNDDSFGRDGATEAEQAGYRAYLAAYLSREFPDADITINSDDCARLIVKTDSDIDADEREVRETGSRAWEACRWEWVDAA